MIIEKKRSLTFFKKLLFSVMIFLSSTIFFVNLYLLPTELDYPKS